MYELQELIKNGIKNMPTENTKPRIESVYYISEIFKCIRQIYYSRTTEEKEVYSFSSLQNFAHGNITHELIQKILSNNTYNLKVFNEVQNLTINIDNIEVHGRLDTLLINENNNKYIYEFKTCKDTTRISAPYLSHIQQLNYYLYFYNKSTTFGSIVYVDKSNGNLLEFNTFRFSEELFNNMKKRVKEIDTAIKNKKLPDAEFKNEKNILCNFCFYKKKCDNDGTTTRT